MLRAWHGASVKDPCPRHPWDPRAVSDPGMVVELPNLRELSACSDLPPMENDATLQSELLVGESHRL